MTEEEHQLRKEWHSRVRRAKFFLRYMPRRANLERYPIIKWFARSARKRDYLWSFRPSEVIPAFYAGWILALLPLVGFQIAIGLVLALVLRANLMILIGLQMITNPLTITPIWWANYEVGNAIITVVSSDPPPELDADLIEQSAELGLIETVRTILSSAGQGQFREMAQSVTHFFGSLSLGGIVIGFTLAFISASLYRYFGSSGKNTLLRLREVTHLRRKADDADKTPDETPPCELGDLPECPPEDETSETNQK